MESSTKRSVKYIQIARVISNGKPMVRMTIVRNDDEEIHGEIYNDIDTAVNLLRPVWERFDYDEKPGREYYGNPVSH